MTKKGKKNVNGLNAPIKRKKKTWYLSQKLLYT